MMSKFLGSDHSCRRRYVAKLLAERKKNNNERDICQLAYAKSSAKTTGTYSPDGHATIHPKWRNFEKKRWTVRQQWLVVTRPLADCRTKFFRRFMLFGEILKKSVAERSRDSGRSTRHRWMTVKQRFLDVSSNSEKLRRKSLKVTRQWSEVTRPLDDCQTTFLDVSSNSEKFRKKSLKVTRQWSEVTRPLDDCQTTFLDVSSNSEIFWKKSLKVTRQWSEVTRPLYDCQTTFFWRFKQFEIFLKKVPERSSDSGRRSRDRWMTVKQRF